MPAHSFADFCHKLCHCLGHPAPDLAGGDSAHPPAFTIEVSGVPMAFMQASPVDDAEAVLMVDYGPLPPRHRAEILERLMQANFLMLGARAPVFGLDPASGHVVYHVGFVASQADPARLGAGLAQLAEGVLRWREEAWTSPRTGEDQPPAPAPELSMLGRLA